jgi:lipopolysaccharide export system protein LptC
VTNRWFSFWDWLLLYLPAMLMAVLALGSYWLVRTTPPSESAPVPTLLSHTPDYMMDGFSVQSFDTEGRLRSIVKGTQARHYPDTQWTEIDAIRIRSFDTKGRVTNASALRGLSNEDGSEVQLLGNALVVRDPDLTTQPDPTPRMQYKGEFLHAFIDTEMVTSHLPVEIERGKDRFFGDTMDFDNVAQTLKLEGRVRGTIVPKKQKSE